MLNLPLYDLPTRSASGFIIRYVLPRTLPPQLIGPSDRRQPFQVLTIGDVIIGVGHGDAAEFCGHNDQVILDIHSIPDVKGKVVVLISCQTARELGPALIDAGASSYIGFKEDLVWVMDSDLASSPWSDALGATVMIPITNCVNTVMDGKTTGKAFSVLIEGLSRNAEVEEDELIRSCILFNKQNAVLLGDDRATIRARLPLALPFKMVPPPPLLPIF